MTYFTTIDKYMASPINDKRTHEEQHIRIYIYFLIAAGTDSWQTVNNNNCDNIHELYGDSNYYNWN